MKPSDVSSSPHLPAVAALGARVHPGCARHRRRTVLAAPLIAFIAALAGCPPIPIRPTPGNGVLQATKRQPAAAPAAAGKVVRARNVVVSTVSLAPPRNQLVDLPLFDDTVVHAVGVRTEAAGAGYVWIGQLRGEPMSQVILSVQGSTLVGNVLTEKGEIYEIRPAGNGVHIVRQLDPTSFPDDDVNSGPAAEVLAKPNPVAEPCGGTDTGESIDVLLAYTATARINNGGVEGIEALIYGAIAATNQSYLNSGITQRMRVVHLQEDAYAETGNSCTDLTRLRNPSDGFLDTVATARDTYGADLVLLIVDGALTSTSRFTAAGARLDCAGTSTGVFGEAFNILNPNTTAFEPNALAVIQASAATSNLTLAHEAGHLMGARHERLGDPTNGSPFNDNHGFFNNAAGCLQRSVMTRIAACSTCTRVPFWSNPGTTRCGSAFGIAAPAATAADNHNALNSSAATVANFRCSSPGRADVWMRDTWDDTGAQPDPRTASQDMWRSPYIWVRTSQDPDRVHQHEHQTPALNSNAFVYVKLHNGIGGAANGTVELYWAHSSTGLAWPGTWTLAGTAPVTGFAPSSTLIVEIPWTTPASAPSAVGHFCLIARYVSAADPIVGETADINANVRNSNNLVWRNLEPLAPSGDGTSDAVFVVRNLSAIAKNPQPLALRIAPTADEANGSFLLHGQVELELDEALFAQWRRGGQKGHGFELAGGTRLRITDPDGAVLENLLVPREAQVRVRFVRGKDAPARTFHIEATQLVLREGKVPLVLGGVTYELGAEADRDR
jgi:Metallo-peptidase family M12